MKYSQNRFNGGAWSPLLYGRDDLEDYPSACRTLVNFYPHAHGPLTRRPGFRHVCPVKFEDRETLLIPFQFSTTQAYQIELGDLYARFYKDQGQIVAKSWQIGEITQANPGVVSIGSHNFLNGDIVKITAVRGMTELNSREYTVANKTADTFELDGVDTSVMGAYVSGGWANQPYEIVCPWSAAQVRSVRFVQSADTMYLVHGEVKTQKLTRSGHGSWIIEEVDFRGPWGQMNLTTTALTPSATTGDITITASDATGINGGSGFTADDVGRQVAIVHGTVLGYAKITAITTNVLVDATVLGEFGDITAQSNWRLGVFSDALGWPRTATFHQQRLILGGSPTYPETYWFSAVDDYEDFGMSSTIVDSDGGSYSLAGSEVNAIQALCSGKRGRMLIVTASGVWAVEGSSEVGITPLIPPRQERSSGEGGAFLSPLVACDTALFLQYLQKSVLAVRYSAESGGEMTDDISLKAEHLFRLGISSWCYQQQPNSMLWACNEEGGFVSATYLRSQNVSGWSSHETDGGINSVSVIHGSGRDELWAVVFRHGRRCVEFLEGELQENGDIADAFYLDAGLTYDGSPTTTVYGLDHLEGQSVVSLADGKPQPPALVVGGSITIPISAAKIHVGLPYTSDFSTMPFAFTDKNGGSSHGRLLSANNVAVKIINSLGFSYGQDFSEMAYKAIDQTYWNIQASRYTGDILLEMECDQTFDPAICIRVSKPLPFSLSRVTANIEVSND